MWITGLIIFVLISIAIQQILEVSSERFTGYTVSTFIKLYGIKLYGQTIIKHFWLFYIGMAIARFRNGLLPMVRKYWWSFLLLSVFFYLTGFDIDLYYKFFRNLFLSLGLIGFAYKFPKLAVPFDISYGIYLYHGIVLNLFVHLGWKGTWLNFIEVFLITLVISFISTMTIGKFSAGKKRQRLQTQQRLEATSR